MTCTPLGNNNLPKLNLEDIDYNLQISLENEKIKILLKPIDTEIPFLYNFEATLEELRNINKIFSVFDSMEEIKEFLIEFSSKNENIKIIENKTIDEDNEQVVIQIKYSIGKISKSINITLSKIITDDKKMIKYLSKLLSFYKQKSTLVPIDSNLITNIKQIELIKSGINNLDKSKTLKLNLLFRATRDGDTTKSFHEKVDGKYPTISIIQTKNNYIFGGFTEHPWDSKSGCVRTKNTFMFSFNKNKIYIGKNGGSIHCAQDHGPWFCGGAGVYLDNYFEKNNSYQWDLKTNKGSFDGFTEEFELVGGNKNFIVKEVEVFQVEYI